ncbi:iron-sulfur cluster carrier protein ApbC [Avibacterium paragallinarum]|uniref:Iron-sulfur cluster carrier protein n=1 Tax=Avibacterium paragallinarum TaxID=728 RepID=A0AAE5TI70_AVIPA|nr:iron-sulfur cluster carrier protein ApbC [Avibacterium paragallinarum]MEE3608703.1 iron-sulfur cluster carrier protein ApbC [Avibacterium paragallinarum]MEE3621655.1 iron-sulfur cluster carrier protein ApbC [Avibacterium paragallinarum]MEE3668618.1 iron-sulfur cluster carrier protein ApbC [Avibacterium paragallinarum]MEE3681054.1 iron-sulfur cluster carrier protein ApbC [Avibacterium paragallinarum]MEE4385736.1 iron-sulfur cluster carrier protein ApbC [Avibacterium paragallinarum]
MHIHFSANLSEAQQADIQQLFQQFQHETLQQNLLALNAIKKVELGAEILRIELVMPFAWNTGFEQLKNTLSKELQNITHANEVKWVLNYQIATLKRANNHPAVKGIKNIIAVSSGKGGVGKSTVSVNLALALQAQGAKVGLLDADIYGPSVPHMLGVADQRPTSPDNKHINPIEVYGLRTNSIGYLMEPDNATIWRGPMASSALSQLLQETIWAKDGVELDYLVIDMPPGTGDIQLTLSQQIPVTGAIVVTTPQDIALIDAIKGISMFQRVSVPVLGIVENMSVHICSHCGHHEAIFGTGGAEKMAEKYQVKVLAQQPLHIRLREDMDKGKPTVISAPESEIAQSFLRLAEKVASELYWQGEIIPSEILFKAVE